MDFDSAVRQICAKDKRYAVPAYDLVRVALDHAQKLVHGEMKKGKSIANRHVSGPQLLEGFRQYVLENYGPLSYPLLQNWGLKTTRDVGNIVFNIIETGLFGRSPEDSLEAFMNVYDFKTTFLKPFEPERRAD